MAYTDDIRLWLQSRHIEQGGLHNAVQVTVIVHSRLIKERSPFYAQPQRHKFQLWRTKPRQTAPIRAGGKRKGSCSRTAHTTQQFVTVSQARNTNLMVKLHQAPLCTPTIHMGIVRPGHWTTTSLGFSPKKRQNRDREDPFPMKQCDTYTTLFVKWTLKFPLIA